MRKDVFKETNVAKAYLQLSVPLVCSIVVTLIYNLADTFFVAQTNDTNIVAGVSLGMLVFTLLMTIIFQSMGKAAGAFILSVSRQGVLFALVLVVSYRIAGYEGIIVSQAVSDVITAVIALVLFRQQISSEFRVE